MGLHYWTERLNLKAVNMGWKSPFRPGASRILIYHGVVPRPLPGAPPRLMALDRFLRQMQLFKKHFNVCTLEDFFARKFSKDRFNIALTFDDGYQNNIDHVLPILERMEIPATIFFTGVKEHGEDILWPDLLDITALQTDKDLEVGGMRFSKGSDGHYQHAETATHLHTFIQQSGSDTLRRELMAVLEKMIPDFRKESRWFDHWKLADEAGIRKVAASRFVKAGSHGYLHNDLGRMPHAEAVRELHAGKSYVERVTGKAVDSISWPDGSYTRDLVEEAARAGFRYQLASEYLYTKDRNDDRIADRLEISPYESSDRIFMYNVCRL